MERRKKTPCPKATAEKTTTIPKKGKYGVCRSHAQQQDDQVQRKVGKVAHVLLKYYFWQIICRAREDTEKRITAKRSQLRSHAEDFRKSKTERDEAKAIGNPIKAKLHDIVEGLKLRPTEHLSLGGEMSLGIEAIFSKAACHSSPRSARSSQFAVKNYPKPDVWGG